MKNNLLLFGLMILLGCANPQPPSGGPPDKTPPVILEFSPNPDTVNFFGNTINLVFNKYMDKNKVIENIFISPSVKMEYDWSGKELEIEFTEDLDSNTTYVFSLGTEYTDLKQNKPTDAFTLIFSTGTYIDSGMIEGTLFDKQPSGVFIYAYKIDDIDPDTLNPGHTKPNYRTQAGTSGKFKLFALKEGTYRIIAIRDQFKDEVYNEGSDDFGAAPIDVTVKSDSIPTVNLKIGGTIDNTGPLLFDVEPIYSNIFSLNFSEPVDTSSVSQLAFKLSDSLETTFVDVMSVMVSPVSPDRVWIFTKSELDTNTLWKITCASNDSIALKDTSGISIEDTANIAYFYSVPEKDTTQIEFVKIPFPDSTKNIDIYPKMNFEFSRTVNKEAFDQRIKLLNESGDNVKFGLNWKSDNNFNITPRNNLESLKWYKLFIDLDSLCYANGSCFKDSTIQLAFQIKDTRNYGGAKGNIKGLNTADSSLIIIFSNGQNSYSTTPADSGKWSLPNLPSGKYTVEVFYDYDGNGRYSFGNCYPFKHSEPFIIMKGETEIPSRWTIEMTLPMIGK